MKTIFITGTDTDVGKTFISTLLLQAFAGEGLKTFALKPLATGGTPNTDALKLQQHATLKYPLSIVNPIVFDAPIAPHIAASQQGEKLTAQRIQNVITKNIQKAADINLIEGVGGWAVPLNENEQMADVIETLKLPTILVVGLKLGCLNHALLTYQDIKRRDVPLMGWVANCVDPDMLNTRGNIDFLQEAISAPCLGIVPYQATVHNSYNKDINKN